MSSLAVGNKPHVVCIPLPFQSHIKAMLQFAQLLHHRGFHITFVNTDFNHKRFLKSLGPNSLDRFPDFRFETIPDGLPSSDEKESQDIPLLCDSLRRNCLAPFRNLLNKLNGNMNLPVTSIVSDGFLTFTITVAKELGIPIAQFFTLAAVGFMSFKIFPTLVEKGFAPLKDESCITNELLDTLIDWVPGVKDIRIRDLSGSWRTTNPDDISFNFALEAVEGAHKASAVIVHTFEALEPDVLEALSSTTSMLPPVYAIGPLQLLLNQIPEHPLKSVGYSLWKEETECLHWLNGKIPNSVVYVNFGSVVVMTPQYLIEFAWGLANSKLPFLWVVRPDLIAGKSAILPPEFVAETKERGLTASWCPQDQVLNHPSIGGFLTHSGWNSTMESISAGVPMLCWPLIGDQRINCRYTCYEWGIGMEISNDVKRDEVQKLIEELMVGEKAKKLKNKVMEWKILAKEATAPLEDLVVSSSIGALVYDKGWEEINYLVNIGIYGARSTLAAAGVQHDAAKVTYGSTQLWCKYRFFLILVRKSRALDMEIAEFLRTMLHLNLEDGLLQQALAISVASYHRVSSVLLVNMQSADDTLIS